MTDIVIASAARTAVGSFGGSFAKIPAHDLGSAVLSALVERAGIKKKKFQKLFSDKFFQVGKAKIQQGKLILMQG